MRPIDADALIKRWNEMSVRGRTEFDQEIMMAPSIDINRPQGEWIIHFADLYCPNCGARMKGANDE
jgi:hypothetical protein